MIKVLKKLHIVPDESCAIVDKWYSEIDWKQLSHDERCRVIYLIEAAAYCELTGEPDIKRSVHLYFCEWRLAKITNGERVEFGGTHNSISKNPELNKIYFDITTGGVANGKKKRNTRITPNIPRVKGYVESLKDGKSVMRVLKREAKVDQPPLCVFEPSINVSDAVTCTKNPPADKTLSPRGPNTVIRKISRISP